MTIGGDPARRAAPDETGIPGLDEVTRGGVPADRVTLVSGTAGAGQDVSPCSSSPTGIGDDDEPGVFVTFEERPEATRRTSAPRRDVEGGRREDKWRSSTPRRDPSTRTSSSPATTTCRPGPRVRHAVEQTGAKRVAIDSAGALIDQFDERPGRPARAAPDRLPAGEAGVTTVMTAERTEDFGPISRFGFEEFVADNVDHPAQRAGPTRSAGAPSRCSSCAAARTSRASTCSPQSPAGAWSSSRRRSVELRLRVLDASG